MVLKMKRPKTKGNLHIAVNGPYHNKKIFLTGTETTVFKVGKWHGAYHRKASKFYVTWVPV